MAAQGVSGLAVVAMAGGAVLLWSGINGRNVSEVLRSLISGKSPPGADPKLGITASFDASTGTTGTTGTTGGGSSGGTVNAQGLTNPIGKGLTHGRTDMGVDFGGSGPLYAIGAGTITNVTGSGWEGGPYILLKLDKNVGTGYVYYAEGITPGVSVGQQVKAGDLIGQAYGGSHGIEVGWGTSTPNLAAAHGHYTEGVPTPEGQSFRALLTQLGAP